MKIQVSFGSCALADFKVGSETMNMHMRAAVFAALSVRPITEQIGKFNQSVAKYPNVKAGEEFKVYPWNLPVTKETHEVKTHHDRARLGALTGRAQAQQEASTLDRTVLPIAEPTYPTITELDARNVKAPPIFETQVKKSLREKSDSPPRQTLR